ncbi:MAG: hypothetical protein IK118_01005 [Clostridia bacterium]|nr:hypothetical protein [Clostridia bacterium]
MKRFNKALSFLVAAVLTIAVLSPAMFSVTAHAKSVASWNETADIGGASGSITSTDAKAILRVASYIDPVPEGRINGDFDLDGRVTTRDARLTLRYAAGLETKTSILLARLMNANALKVAPEGSHRKRYVYTKEYTSYGDIAVKAGLSITGTAMNDMQDEIREHKTETTQNAQSYTSSYYNSYLPVADDENFVVPEIPESLVKSITYTPASDDSYTVKVVFNDFIVSKKSVSPAAAKVLLQVIPDLHDSATVKKMSEDLLGTMGDVDGITVTIHDSIAFATSLVGSSKTYKFQNSITNPTVEYKFSAQGYPVSATYYSMQTITIPATLKMGIDTATFAMMSMEETTYAYTFSYT